MKEDSIMQKIRRIRTAFFNRCGGDLDQMGKILKRTEKRLRREKAALEKERVLPKKRSKPR